MESENDTITVTLAVFSGRPNPQLVLEGEAAREFADVVRNILSREASAQPPPAPTLWAFNGFLVQLPGELAQSIGAPAEFSVRQGVATQREGAEEKHWGGVGEVERFLMDQAREQGYGDLIERFVTGRPNPSEETPDDERSTDKSVD